MGLFSRLFNSEIEALQLDLQLHKNYIAGLEKSLYSKCSEAIRLKEKLIELERSKKDPYELVTEAIKKASESINNTVASIRIMTFTARISAYEKENADLKKTNESLTKSLNECRESLSRCRNTLNLERLKNVKNLPESIALNECRNTVTIDGRYINIIHYKGESGSYVFELNKHPKNV